MIVLLALTWKVCIEFSNWLTIAFQCQSLISSDSFFITLSQSIDLFICDISCRIPLSFILGLYPFWCLRFALRVLREPWETLRSALRGLIFFNKGIKLPRCPSATTFQDRGGKEKKILLSAQMRENQCYKLFIAQNSVKGGRKVINILYLN